MCESYIVRSYKSRKFSRPRQKIFQKGTIFLVCVSRNLFQKILYIVKRLQIIRFCSFHNTVNDCRRFGSMNRIDHLPILLPNTKSSDCPFAGVIVNRNVSVCEKYPKIFFLIQSIPDSITKFILLGYGYSFQVCKNTYTRGLITACRCLSRSSEERSFNFPSSR